MKKQSTNNILMIKPVAFFYNTETAVNNYFQKKTKESSQEIQKKALSEFNEMVKKLKDKGINIITINDTLLPHTPDSVFPNNWISTHKNGKVGLFPMYAKNRRAERRADVLDKLEKSGFYITETIDYSSAEEDNIFLEGTGSIVLDRANSLAYATISPRTDEELFIEFCEDFEYTPIIFKANQTVSGKKKAIYHTNVMMCIADRYAVVCIDSIDNKTEKKLVEKNITKSGKKIIAISEAQMHNFAGNMLQVKNKEGKSFLVMSESAFNSLTENQINQINQYDEIISVHIPTIETLGGGSVRCMMAEIFLPEA